MFRLIPLLTIAFLFFTLCHAQVPTGNPLLRASQSVATKGVPDKLTPFSSEHAFKASGKRETVRRYVQDLTKEREEQEAFESAINTIIQSYEEEAKKQGRANDPAAALAFTVGILSMAVTDKEIGDAAIAKLADRLRTIMAGVQATDASKQEYYELALCSSAIVLTLAAADKDDKSASGIKKIAASHLALLLGITPDQISVQGGDLNIKPKPANPSPPEGSAGAAPATANGLAPGFTFGQPAGWVKRGEWWVNETREESYGAFLIRTAHVRFLPAMPAQGNMGDALRSVWASALPKEFAGRAGSMVYRRYVGDGLFAQLIFGKGVENGRRTDTLFTVMIVDCKSYWQPLVIAQTYEDTSSILAGENMDAGFSFPKTSLAAETMLSTFRCPAALGNPIVAKEALVGNYSFGSGSGMQWENIYTGATSMTYVSYGGDLNLLADGTFTYRYSSASGVAGAAKFAGIKARGTWKLERDILVCNFTEYDQGDSYKEKSRRYRVAGLTQFSDGVKVAVLMSNLNMIPCATTLGDSSDWYSTKKRQ